MYREHRPCASETSSSVMSPSSWAWSWTRSNCSWMKPITSASSFSLVPSFSRSSSVIRRVTMLSNFVSLRVFIVIVILQLDVALACHNRALVLVLAVHDLVDLTVSFRGAVGERLAELVGEARVIGLEARDLPLLVLDEVVHVPGNLAAGRGQDDEDFLGVMFACCHGSSLPRLAREFHSSSAGVTSTPAFSNSETQLR